MEYKVKKTTLYLLPHFFPACLFLILHLFGIVMAIPGLIPACFANGDKRTAHRHLGAVLSNAPTLAQQAGGTFALAFPAAPRHGLKLAAADPIGVLPHSPAASINPWLAISNRKSKPTLVLGAISCWVLLVQVLFVFSIWSWVFI